MEKSKITKTGKGETGEVQSQEHAHNFLTSKQFVLADQTVNSAYYCDGLW
jgi:hypothetical protein